MVGQSDLPLLLVKARFAALGELGDLLLRVAHVREQKLTASDQGAQQSPTALRNLLDIFVEQSFGAFAQLNQLSLSIQQRVFVLVDEDALGLLVGTLEDLDDAEDSPIDVVDDHAESAVGGWQTFDELVLDLHAEALKFFDFLWHLEYALQLSEHRTGLQNAALSAHTQLDLLQMLLQYKLRRNLQQPCLLLMVPGLALDDHLPLLVIFLLLHVAHLIESEFGQFVVGDVRLGVEFLAAVVEGVEDEAEAGAVDVEERDVHVDEGHFA